MSSGHGPEARLEPKWFALPRYIRSGGQGQKTRVGITSIHQIRVRIGVRVKACSESGGQGKGKRHGQGQEVRRPRLWPGSGSRQESWFGTPQYIRSGSQSWFRVRVRVRLMGRVRFRGQGSKQARNIRLIGASLEIKKKQDLKEQEIR